MPYYRRQSSGWGLGFITESVVNQIIIINIIVFILELFLSRTPFIDFFGLLPRLVVTKGYVWQLATYMFLHGGFWHLILNMFIIWMFGTPLEGVWGGDRFLKYYFACGLGAAIFSFIFSFNTTVIGASGAGYGILLAYAVLFPYSEIYVWGLFPVPARTLVAFMVVIEFVSGITGGDGIAHFAHLGGMAAGLLFLRNHLKGWRLRRRPPSSWTDRGNDGQNDRWNN
jgi:membrane associated rhomboid family serine protease